MAVSSLEVAESAHGGAQAQRQVHTLQNENHCDFREGEGHGGIVARACRKRAMGDRSSASGALQGNGIKLRCAAD